MELARQKEGNGARSTCVTFTTAKNRRGKQNTQDEDNFHVIGKM